MKGVKSALGTICGLELVFKQRRGRGRWDLMFTLDAGIFPPVEARAAEYARIRSKLSKSTLALVASLASIPHEFLVSVPSLSRSNGASVDPSTLLR